MTERSESQGDRLGFRVDEGEVCPVTRHLAQLVERTRGTFEAFKGDDWLIGENHVVGLSSIHARSDGRIYKGPTVTVLRFNGGDEIDGITAFFDDLSAIDRFIGPSLEGPLTAANGEACGPVECNVH